MKKYRQNILLTYLHVINSKIYHWENNLKMCIYLKFVFENYSNRNA